MATRKDRRRDQTPGEGHGERSSVPSPGDTLPWNLSKHQRVKRSKSSTGEVLDPAERAVIRIADWHSHLLLVNGVIYSTLLCSVTCPTDL
ncbi:hypothetical protein NQZ68_013285 [Dissostichus eleginoides]|nr:hypothetical protein NQZ68_013285 [Dissostichus eleginoides]